MDIIKLCFAFLGVAFIIFLVRSYNEKFALPTALAASVVFFGYIIVLFTPIYNELKAIASIGINSSYISTMLRALSIAGTTRFVAELCRDCGENGIASKVEVFGKLGIVSLSLPLLRAVIEIINKLV